MQRILLADPSHAGEGGGGLRMDEGADRGLVAGVAYGFGETVGAGLGEPVEIADDSRTSSKGIAPSGNTVRHDRALDRVRDAHAEHDHALRAGKESAGHVETMRRERHFGQPLGGDHTEELEAVARRLGSESLSSDQARPPVNRPFDVRSRCG